MKSSENRSRVPGFPSMSLGLFGSAAGPLDPISTPPPPHVTLVKHPPLRKTCADFSAFHPLRYRETERILFDPPTPRPGPRQTSPAPGSTPIERLADLTFLGDGRAGCDPDTHRGVAGQDLHVLVAAVAEVEARRPDLALELPGLLVASLTEVFGRPLVFLLLGGLPPLDIIEGCRHSRSVRISSHSVNPI